jgi:hypothetical protein
MRVALMVPCYIDTFYPRVGIATLELLERLHVDVVYPSDQTCCGQPMANSGCFHEARDGKVLVVAKVYSMRRLHEYLSGVPTTRRPELRLDLYGPHWYHHDACLRRPEIQ